jgi:predicted transposase/invertase (TIGR01784 family)
MSRETDPRSVQILPTRDSVFKLIFAELTDLSVLASLINAVRSDRPKVSQLVIANPEAGSVDLDGKRILLDVKAKDAEDNLYNIEIQIKKQPWWGERSGSSDALLRRRPLRTGRAGHPASGSSHSFSAEGWHRVV